MKDTETEGTRMVDIDPDKVLRPIGTVFKVWAECLHSNETPHWTWWKIIGYVKTFQGHNGDVERYERVEEVKSIKKNEYFKIVKQRISNA